MAELKTVHLDLPASASDLRNLELGSVVYLKGRLFTAREGVYKRAIEDRAGMPAERDALGIVNFHCSPAASINPDGSYAVGAAPTAASFRCAQLPRGEGNTSCVLKLPGERRMTRAKSPHH